MYVPGQSIQIRVARAAPGAIHVLGAEAPGIRRGLPLAGAVHRLSSAPGRPPPLGSLPLVYASHINVKT